MFMKGKITVEVSYDEFAAMNNLFWGVTRAHMQQMGLDNDQIELIFKMRVTISSWLQKASASSSS